MRPFVFQEYKWIYHAEPRYDSHLYMPMCKDSTL